MKNRKPLYLLLFFISASCLVYSAGSKKADKDMIEWRYEIENAGSNLQGTAQVKVWTYSKNKNVAIDQAKKSAVHGVIFKGTPDNGRIRGLKAIAQDPNIEIEKGEFFKEFFKDGGKYLKFVTLIENADIPKEDQLKVGKENKIGVVVQVNVNALRKDLEDAGIIRSLGSGF